MNRQQFSTYLLDYGKEHAGGAGPTEELVLGLCCWAWAENSGGSNTGGVGAANNPLDMTLSLPTATPFNTFGPSGQYHVYNYKTAAAGAAAFWRCVQNGLYPDILATLRNPQATATELAQCQSLATWGTGTFEAIVAAARANPAPYYAPSVTGSTAPTPSTAPALPGPLSWTQANLTRAGSLWQAEVATPHGTGAALLPASWENFCAATPQGSDPFVDGRQWRTCARVQERTGQILLTVTTSPATSALVFVLLA